MKSTRNYDNENAENWKLFTFVASLFLLYLCWHIALFIKCTRCVWVIWLC